MNARLARFQVIAFLIAAALALSACGNKGPLVLPDEPDESTTPAGDTTPEDTAPADESTPADAAPADEAPADIPDDADASAAPPPEDG